MSSPLLPFMFGGKRADYAALVLAAAPLAYWRCDDPASSGTLADSSGNGYTLNLHGVTPTGEPPLTRYLGAASVHFMVASGYGSVSSSAPFRLSGDMTVELWIALDTDLSEGDIVPLFHCVATGETSATNAQYQYSVRRLGAREYGLFHEYNSGVDQTREIALPAAFDAIAVNHVVITRDAAAKVYEGFLNGESIGTASYTNAPSGGGSTTFQVGRNPATGAISDIGSSRDEMAIYASKLSAATIRAHYLAGRA